MGILRQAGNTSTDQLVAHALELIGGGHIFWTHVTSPFVNSELYDDIVVRYRAALNDGYDSLMSTTAVRGFIWDDVGPINYNRKSEKWPRSQTLTPLHEINSAAFLAPAHVYADLNDRIGNAPFNYPMDKITGMDIDWLEDFYIAESLALRKIAIL